MLSKFCEDLVHWLEADHDYKANWTLVGQSTAKAYILNEDGEDVHIHGSATTGLDIRYLGQHSVGTGEDVELVLINGIVFEALGRHVAAWVAGISN